MRDLAQDLRFGARMLLKTPGFTCIALLTLALGIGVSTALYSVVSTVLLNPVPGPRPDRLVCVDQCVYEGSNAKPFNLTPPALAVLLSSQTSFSDLAWWRFVDLDWKTDAGIEDLSGVTVSPNFFKVWGVNAALGRTFAADEQTIPSAQGIPETDSVILLSHSFWRSFFGGDLNVLGKTIALSGCHFTVIGVMPPQFQFPAGRSTKFWIPCGPIRLPAGWAPSPDIRVLARLKPGVTLRQAQLMLDAAGGRLSAEAVPSKLYLVGAQWNARKRLGFAMRPVRTEFREEELQRTLLSFLGAIGFFLLISCANIANLNLARTERRQQELAIRAALGAGRARLARQVLTESLLIAALGGLAGLCLTPVCMNLLVSLIPQDLPRLRDVHVDGRALGFALLVCLGTGLAFGLAPARHAAGNRLAEALKLAANRATAGSDRRRYRGQLVILEMALTLVLMVGAGLMVQSLVSLLHVKPGLDPHNLMFIKVWLPWERYEHQAGLNGAVPVLSDQLCDAIFENMHDRLASLPGVAGVSFLRTMSAGDYQLDGQAAPVNLVCVACGVEDHDLFRILKVPLLGGRYLTRSDAGDQTGAVLVNESMARRCWPGQNAVGKVFRTPAGSGDAQVYRVAGIVGDYRESYDEQPEPAFYVPYRGSTRWTRPRYFQGMVVRTLNDPSKFIPLLRKELQAIEPAMKAPMFIPVTRSLHDSTRVQQTYMEYLMVFAAAALLVSSIGIYGVMSYSVAQRTFEIGIRMALGAERRKVLRLVLGEGARMVAGGVAVGLVAAFWLMRCLRNQLFGVSPTDPLVFGCMVLVLAAAATVACLVPAIRAMRVDPMIALRDQ